MAFRWNKEMDAFISKLWNESVKPSVIASRVEGRFGFRCTATMVIGRIYRLRANGHRVLPRKPAVVAPLAPRRDGQYRTDWQRLVVPGDVTMPRVEWGGKLL